MQLRSQVLSLPLLEEEREVLQRGWGTRSLTCAHRPRLAVPSSLHVRRARP